MIPPLANLAERLAGCSGVLVDSNVILDVATNDPVWAPWSDRAIAECAEHSILAINPLIYAEISVGYRTIEELEEMLAIVSYQRESPPWEAGFLAGKCHYDYRRRGGKRTAPLPDFYIGAHALLKGMALLTRDRNRFQTYFPRLVVLAPISAEA